MMSEGSEIIWLDDVTCSGTEDHIASCQHRPWGQHDCSHNEDVAVKCSKIGQS